MAGSVLIGVGILVMFTGMNLGNIGGTSYTDIFPGGNEWSNSGTHDNTFNDTENRLVIDDLSSDPASGTFISDDQTNGQSVSVNNIVYEAGNIKTTGETRTIELIIQGKVDNSVVETTTVELENGRFSVPIQGLSNQNFDSYNFIVNLESENSSSPHLSELQISGDEFGDDTLNERLGFVFQWLLIFLGLLMVMRDAI